MTFGFPQDIIPGLLASPRLFVFYFLSGYTKSTNICNGLYLDTSIFQRSLKEE